MGEAEIRHAVELRHRRWLVTARRIRRKRGEPADGRWIDKSVSQTIPGDRAMPLVADPPFRRRPSWRGDFSSKRRSPSRLVGEIALGAAGLAIGGFALYFLKERNQEEAAHRVIERDGAFSLRRYDRLVTAEVTRFGELAEALDQGFEPLYDYISAKPGARRDDDADTKIAMTVPVIARPGERAGDWSIRFVIPRDLARANLPTPANGVVIGEDPARTLAVLRFAGKGTDRDLVAKKRAALLAWVARRGLRALAEPELATYNAPIVPGLLRRNEWWVEVGAADREQADATA
jgi:hypothetical protein